MAIGFTVSGSNVTVSAENITSSVITAATINSLNLLKIQIGVKSSITEADAQIRVVNKGGKVIDTGEINFSSITGADYTWGRIMEAHISGTNDSGKLLDENGFVEYVFKASDSDFTDGEVRITLAGDLDHAVKVNIQDVDDNVVSSGLAANISASGVGVCDISIPFTVGTLS